MEGSESLMGLPVEVWEIVADHLPVADVISCISTCVSWRNVFGSDRVWRSRCNKDHAEYRYLQTTESRVEPRFGNIGTSDTALSPVSEWREYFMRETHVWNNQRLGRYLDEKVTILDSDVNECLKILFYTNDCIFVFFTRNICVWDVKAEPVLVATLPFHVRESAQIKVTDRKDLLVVQGRFVQVYSVNLALERLTIVHTFAVDSPEKMNKSDDNESIATNDDHCTVVVAVADSVCVSCLLPLPNLYLWNIESGLKIKEETFPITTRVRFKSLEACKKSSSLLLVLKDYDCSKEYLPVCHLFVYDLNELEFTSFHISTPSDFYTEYVMFDKYVAVVSNGTLNVYNYSDSEVVFTMDSCATVLTMNNKLMFGSKGFLSELNPDTKHIEAQYEVDYSDYSLAGICGRCFRLVSFSEDAYIDPPVLVVKNLIRGTETVSRTVPVYCVDLFDSMDFNEVGTKLVLSGKGHILVVTFW